MANNDYSLPNSGTSHFSLNHEPNYLTESEEILLYILFALILVLTAVIVYILGKALKHPAVDYNNNNENVLQHNRQQG